MNQSSHGIVDGSHYLIGHLDNAHLGSSLNQIFGHFQWRLIPQVVSGYGAVMALMAAGYLLHMLPRRAEAWGERTVAGAPLAVKALMLTVLIWCVMQIKSSEIQPFIYFQF